MMESDVRKNLQLIESDLSGFSARLLPVSKTFPVERILPAYEAGYKDFGENKVQEIMAKKEELPSDIRWHLIGHLQSNKVKYIAPFIYMIHSVDSEKLLCALDEYTAVSLPVLIQVNISGEGSKEGCAPDEAVALIQAANQSRNTGMPRHWCKTKL
jgi:uncharacterized pyridoxal phosphate-containing UPF0001 family protein